MAVARGRDSQQPAWGQYRRAGEATSRRTRAAAHRATFAWRGRGSIVEMPRKPVRPNLTWTAGVDGCRGGWVVALVCFRGDGAHPVRGSLHLCASFADVLALRPRARMVALDMPIGLL